MSKKEKRKKKKNPSQQRRMGTIKNAKATGGPLESSR
jgi:hypothetical protein